MQAVNTPAPLVAVRAEALFVSAVRATPVATPPGLAMVPSVETERSLRRTA
jgi:hypothetical protein